MLQGIFEPVAERKKSTMDRIARDFPERRFILIGDSGEADLEVYLDFVKENPGRVLGIFIRDVTTPSGKGYFDQNVRSGEGESTPKRNQKAQASNDEQDAELAAAIQASLKDFEADEARRKNSATKSERTTDNSDDLMTFSDSDNDDKSSAAAAAKSSVSSSSQQTQSAAAAKPRAPPPPKKPDTLRGQSTRSHETKVDETTARSSTNPSSSKSTATVSSQGGDDRLSNSKKTPPAPPPPRRTTSSSKTPATENDQDSSVTEIAMEKLEDVYESLPSAPWSSDTTNTINDNPAASSRGNVENNQASNDQSNNEDVQQTASTRRLMASYPAAAAQYASNRIGSAINYYYSSGGNNDGQMGVARAANDNGLSKSQNNRIELWKQRWSKAEAVLRKEGVLLRSWKIGNDAIDDSVRLVERARKQEKESNIDVKKDS